MGDADLRGRRDSRADRYGGDSETTGAGGRYNRARYRRDDGDDDLSDPFQRRQRQHASDDGIGMDDSQAHRQRRPRTEGGDGGYGAPWQQQQQFPPYMNQSGGGAGMGFPFPDMMMPMNAQHGFPGASGGNNLGHPFMNGGAPGAMPFGFIEGLGPNGGHGGGGMSSDQLLQFLLQQQQQQPASSPSASPPPRVRGEGRSDNVLSSGQNSVPAATRVLPSVDEFVPVVPKSLMNLVVGGGAQASGEGDAAGAGSTASPHPQSGNGQGGALVLLEAPKIGPDADRRAREQRRAHVSGFPLGTTREELEDYFLLLLPEVRRLQTERQIRELAEKVGLIKEEGEEAVRHIPATANLSNIDEVRSISVNPGRVKSFSFIELRLADMIDELVSQSAADPHRFLFNSSLDGQTYPLMIRRPRDADPLTGVDESKVVLVGFPPSMSEEAIKPAFESYGTLLKFELRGGYAYGEFAEVQDATDFRADLHGAVLGNNVVVALPLYDWLKALLVREGIDVTIDDDDPVSGKYVMKQVRERLPETSALGAAGTQAGGAGGVAGGDAGAGGSSALVVAAAEDPEAASLQIMRELLDMSFTLPDMLGRFATLYPHLRPLYANSQLTVFATPVLVLLNLFDEEELVYDSHYSRLLADIEEEVEKYGRVKRLLVPRREARPKLPEAPKPGVDYDEDDETAKAAAMAAYGDAKKNFAAELGRYMTRQTHPVWGGYGRVFVEYETVDEAAEAQQQIAGKLFGERTVVTSFLFPDLLRETDEAETTETEAPDVDREGGGESAGNTDGDGDKDGDAAASQTEVEEEGAPLCPQPQNEPEAAGDAPEEVSAKTPSVHAEDID